MSAELLQEPTKVKLEIPKGMRKFERQINGKVYRANVPQQWRDDHVFLHLFGRYPAGEDKFNCWKGWVMEHWPEPIFIWDRWSDIFFAAACGHAKLIEQLTGYQIDVKHEWWRYIILAGNASSGKTSRVAMWMLGNWVIEQEKTSCVLTSTSIDQLKRRTWSELVHWITDSRFGFKGILEIVTSDTLIRLPSSKEDPMDTKAAIFGRAVDQGGSTQNAVDRIKGVHNWRMFVGVDEMTSMPEAITKACRNLKKGTKEFQFFGLGNPNSHDDQHGIFSEPIDGWNNITVEDEFWLTAKGGCCIHFDGMKSPGIAEPEKYHFYTNQNDIDEDLDFFGGENDPGFWSETRGFWPPGGLSNIVIDPALFDQFSVKDGAIWKNGFEMCAFLDPAFEGGDRRVLYPFKMGEFTNGITGIEYQDPIIVSVDMTKDKRWIHYQIADAVQNLCENWTDPITDTKMPIVPANFMADTSGEGGGLFSIMSGRWSPAIHPCEFGGAADKTQIFPDRPTTHYEEYANRVTMLYYVLRRYIEGGQIKGLSDPETRTELSTRPKDNPRGGKKAILPKSKVKGAKRRSPDKADAAVGCTEFMRLRGVAPSGTTGAVAALSAEVWNKAARKINSFYDDEPADAWG